MPKPRTPGPLPSGNETVDNSLTADLMAALERLKQQTEICLTGLGAERYDEEELNRLYEQAKYEGSRGSSQSKLKVSVKNMLKVMEERFDENEELMKSLRIAQQLLEAKKHEVMLKQQKATGVGGTPMDKQGSALSRSTLMLLLQNAAMSIPMWVSLSNRSAPPLCGAIPAAANHICKPGDLCVAKVKGGDYWILAEVKAYYAAQSKYSIEDIDEEQKEKHVLGRKKIIPLPLYRANPELNPEALFEANREVLALYPQTTCFYRGVVQRQPLGPSDNYLVAFEDSSYSTGFSPALTVPQRYVVSSSEL